MNMINENKKVYDPVTEAGMKLGNVLLLAGGLCFFIRLLIVTFTTMGMMQGFLSLLVVGAVLVTAGGVYLLVGMKSAAGMLTSHDSGRKKEYKMNILKSVRVIAVITGVILVMLTSNSGVDLMPAAYLCIAVVAGITVVIIKKKH